MDAPPEVAVSGCHECPAARGERGPETTWFVCALQRAAGDAVGRFEVTRYVLACTAPEWCRLRAGPLLLRLRGKQGRQRGPAG